MMRKSQKNKNRPEHGAARRSEPYASTNHIEIALFAAELGGVPEIDLHELTVDQAEYAADRFIDQQFVAGSEAIRIIHGRGKQILRNAIHHLLWRDHVRVAGFRDSQAPGQQGGVTVIALHRIR